MSTPRNKQTPGAFHVFSDRGVGSDSGILPDKHGESNDFAFWKKESKIKVGGAWHSRKLHLLRLKQRYTGKGPTGLLGRMRVLHVASKNRDARQGYAPFKSTPEEMLKEWESQKNKCAACFVFLDLLKSHYDHDHESGEGRGFVHPNCNRAEGAISKMSDEEFENFVSWERRKRNIS